jgi:hypothetical protein
MLLEWSTPQVTEIFPNAQARYNASPKGRARMTRYDAGHREKRTHAARNRRASHPECNAIAGDKWRRANPVTRLLQAARRRAKERGIEFSITEADLQPVPTHCPILGVKLRYGGRGFNYEAASIDRLDNSLGYIAGNVFMISRRANIMKSDGTADEHRAIAAWMNSVGG